MDVSAITSLISSVGFPIFVSLILFYYIAKEQEKLRETLNDLIQTLKDNTNITNNLVLEVKEIHNKIGVENHEGKV